MQLAKAEQLTRLLWPLCRQQAPRRRCCLQRAPGPHGPRTRSPGPCNGLWSRGRPSVRRVLSYGPEATTKGPGYVTRAGSKVGGGARKRLGRPARSTYATFTAVHRAPGVNVRRGHPRCTHIMHASTAAGYWLPTQRPGKGAVWGGWYGQKSKTGTRDQGWPRQLHGAN